MQTPWQLAYQAQEDFDGGVAAKLDPLDWRDIQLPCSVQNSPFGLPLKTLYRGDRVREVAWMRDRYWLFRTCFTCPQAGPDEEAVYRFQGIDYHCLIYLDRRFVLEHEGMFSAVEAPLGKAGQSHELLVVIKPFAEGEGAPENLKARYSAGKGWDFAPEILSAGIWDTAELLVRKKLRIVSAAVKTVLANGQRADIVIHADLSERVETGRVLLEIDGVRRTFPVVGADRLALPVNIPSPTLWWPNGMGPASLVLLKLELAVEGRTAEPFQCKTGLRSVERVPCRDQGVEDIPLQLMINNQKVFIKGVNWVPPDACPGAVTRERYELFLRRFKEAGVNFVRVWGGGLAEKDSFYELADEMGLMIMQEFPLACQQLARTPAFYRLLKQEASAIINRLKSHPSVVVWCGGNEHYHYWDNTDSGSARMERIKEEIRRKFEINEANREWRGGADKYDEPALALLGQLCALLDDSRPFQITSGMEGEGEIHGIWTWDPAVGDHRYRDYETIYEYWLDAGDHLFSECSVPSLANLETVREVTGCDEPGLPKREDPVWRMHHAFGAAWESEDTWFDLPSVEKFFGRITDLDRLVLASQWMQAEGGRFLIEEIRRKIGHTSGVVWWGVNEPWPGLAGNALIDYFGRPKLGWHYLANAFRRTILSLRYENCVARRFKPELWISHDGREAFNGHYSVEVKNLQTEARDHYEGTIACNGYESRYIKTLIPVRLYPGIRLHVCCLLHAGGQLMHKNDYVFASAEDAVPFDTEIIGLTIPVHANQCL